MRASSFALGGGNPAKSAASMSAGLVGGRERYLGNFEDLNEWGI